ncbi:MAG: hypothetical protein B6I20_09440 [Bacteroidetes bacterium 4572_117]|nr:MAG: hypothetical protein B6I20_09440 [Bacteroidetes bacterium 4572_117]
MREKFKTTFEFAKNNTLYSLFISENNDNKVYSEFQDIEEVVKKVSKNRNIIRKAYSISVELIENVKKYGVLADSFKNKFLLGYYDSSFYFLSFNLVHNKDVDFITGKFEQINSLFAMENSKELLREAYKNKLKEVSLSENDVKVGVINLVRKLDSKLLYNFEKVNDDYSVLSLICSTEDKGL